MPALSALHSAVQSFAVFELVAVVCLGSAGGAVSAGLAAGAAADGSAPPLHCSTYYELTRVPLLSTGAPSMSREVPR